MDAQAVLDTALSAGAVNLGNPEAAKIFREQLKSTPKVHVLLTNSQKSQLRKMISFPVVFTGGKIVTNDHPILVACRDLTRDSFEAEFKIENTTERTLIVGASAREIQRYNSNPHIHYYVHGRENKDYDRVIRPALLELNRIIKGKAQKADRRVFLPPPNHKDATALRPAVKRYEDFKSVLSDYMELKKLPQTIHLDYVEANTLVLEDSFYNFGVADYVELFETTGAEIAYGYGLLPLELLFPDMPENPLYSVSQQGKNSILTFRQGYCNGYIHNTAAWKTLLENPVLTKKNSKVQLAVEITARVGPMATFKIFRCRNKEQIVRNIELSEGQRFVKVMDIMQSVNRRTGKMQDPAVYFSMCETEYLDVVNYLMSLDPKSMTFNNTIAYIRRRMGGMSLITKELIEPWFLPKRKVVAAALTIFLSVKLRTEEQDLMRTNLDIGSVTEKFLAFFRKTTRALFFPITVLIDWILAGHLVDSLILDANDRFLQLGNVFPSPLLEHDDLNVGLYLDNPYEGDIPTCPICLEMYGRLGKQIVRCEHLYANKVELKMSDKQIQEMRNNLIDTDSDPPGLAAVKKRCLESMPTTGFSTHVTVNHIKAGPGCGKSYLIRQLATPSDLVLAPFTKLRPDYINLKNEEGESYDLQFKTTHRAMETRGCKRIFVDEFTSMPYEFLCCIAMVNGAEEIFLVGDEKQTKVQEPEEGMYIGNYIDLNKVSVHELVVNFRNPKDVVALLNKTYGYKMVAHSEIETSIEFVTQEELPSSLTAVRMAFSKVSAKANTEDERNTVRANQGGTHKTSVVYCTIADGNVPGIEELQIVALSRHTDKLYIVVDGCDESEKLRAKLQLDADFYEHMQTWLTFPNEPTMEVLQEDKDLQIVFGGVDVHPPKDMHLMADTFLPSAAFDEQVTSMNQLTSALVPQEFNTGKTDPDLFIMPKNNRGHPQTLNINYFAMSSGIGNHFQPKSPEQVLQVLQARYFNKQPNFTLTYNNRLLAKKMVDLWFEEHVLPNYSAMLFDDAEIQAVVSDFLKKVTSSHYQESFRGMGGIDSYQGRWIRFHLKGIFKPKHGEPDVFKAGQGISAWSTDACAMFCSVFRILTKLVSKTEQPHVVTDGYFTEEEFMRAVNGQLRRVPTGALFATTDGITFDANQNAFTQLIEKIYWRKFGVPEEFLDHYYSFRERYKVVSAVAVGFAGTQKTSGEPGTLVNNGVVSKVVSNYEVRGVGPCAVIYKGDDFTKYQVNVQMNLAHEADVKGACALGLKVTIAATTDFCGLMFSEGYLFPSIPRRLNKVLSHRFKSYQHFCEYQDSLRNWLKLILKLGELQIVASNTEHYGTTFCEMLAALDFLKCISHIDQATFCEHFKARSEVAVIPVNTGRWEFMECVGPADVSTGVFESINSKLPGQRKKRVRRED